MQRLIDYDRYWQINERDGLYVRTNRWGVGEDGKVKLIGVEYLARWVLNIKFGNKCRVDHVNHNNFDNRKHNLRITDDLHNSKNRRSKNKNNKSGYRNVYWCNKSNRWVVVLMVDKKRKYLGAFKDVHEAGAHAELMRQKYYGEFAGNN